MPNTCKPTRISFLDIYLHSWGIWGALQDLWMSSNHFSSSIPSSLSNLIKLTNLLLHDNSLTGSLDRCISPANQSNLQVVDLSNNLLTGSIPASVFALDSIIVIALVKNCLTTTLTTDMCGATRLTVLALDGLHTAERCQLRYFPRSLTMTAYSLSSSVSGTIPWCLFAMPQLTTLHLSEAAFEGPCRLMSTSAPNLSTYRSHTMI